MYEKIIAVTRKTRLQELIAKFNTIRQARFYIEHAGGDFADYQIEDENYRRALEDIQRQMDKFGSSLKTQYIDREFLPSFLFSEKDIVLAIGQDGLVANAAKYVGSQPIIGVNPDPARFDGILVPVHLNEVSGALRAVTTNSARLRTATLAEVLMNDGQKLLAFNDLFIGSRTHVSARYRLEFSGFSESQSSSGLIVSTAAGSTGWLSSILNMVSSVHSFCRGDRPAYSDLTGRAVANDSPRISSTGDQLCFVVREPFVSKHSSANMVIGMLERGQELIIESRMPAGGTIFSDGIESDFISFDSGMVARVRTAQQVARLVMPASSVATQSRSARTVS
ncbi:MAG: hypothetical protein K2W95_02285 [Candidatus Obscuribacterales bacterium]|nr:hypothetical protein [Candidatus Obscuribacterales bacterium]